MEGFELEETFEVHLVQPPAVGRDIFHLIGFLKTPSSLTLNTSSDGASRASVDVHLCQCLTTFIIKHFFLGDPSLHS